MSISHETVTNYKIYYLTQAQYDALVTSGSITVDGQTIQYDPTAEYRTPDNIPEEISKINDVITTQETWVPDNSDPRSVDYAIAADGTWVSSGDPKSYRFESAGIVSLEVFGRTDRSSYVSLLKTLDTSLPPDPVSAETLNIEIKKNTSAVIAIPAECRYILVTRRRDTSASFVPTRIIFTRYIDFNGSEEISEYGTSWENIYDPNYLVDLPSPLTDPENPFPIDIEISKAGNKYGHNINISDYVKTGANTATYYMSPDGDDSNSGLDEKTPLKTLAAALAKADVNTIILLPGTYENGVHFGATEINKGINMIGRGTVVLKSSSYQSSVLFTAACYVENIVFNGGKTGACRATLQTELLAFNRCAFINSWDNGLKALGGTYLMYRCIANNNRIDGFNYHGNDSYKPQVVEIQCSGFGNGVNAPDGENTNNGSTAHENGTRVIRIGCRYSSCRGGIVADSNKAFSLNINVTAFSTLELENTGRTCSFQSGNGADMWLFDCDSFGSPFDLCAISGESNDSVIHTNRTYLHESTSGGSTITRVTVSVTDPVADLAESLAALQPAATEADVGKALIVKTVDQQTGKPTSYEYGEAGGGGDLSNCAPVIIETAGGSVASFPDGADGLPLKSLTVNIEPVQSGTGDPSPTNVRPISGWTGCNISHSGADTSEPVITPIAFTDPETSDPLTVYGGTLTVSDDGSAALTIDRGFYTLYGSENWELHNTLANWFSTSIWRMRDPKLAPYSNDNESDYALSNLYKQEAYKNRVTMDSGRFCLRYEGSTGRVVVKDARAATAEEFKALLAAQNMQICYRLAEPYTISLPQQVFETLLGTNNIWADCGPVSVDYPADTKLYIQPINAAVDAQAQAVETIEQKIPNQASSTNQLADKDFVNARDDTLYAAILSGGGDYKATMRSFFLANGANAMVDLTALCDRWYSLSRTGWTGGVRFSQPEEGVTMSSDGTKTGDNAGLSCTPSTTTEANRDDYANLPLFAVADCNVTLDADGKPHVTAIEGIAGGFERDDPAKIVCCMQMTGWMRAVEDAETFGFDYTDQAGTAGFVPLPEAVELKDNAVRSWVVHCKYGAGDAWGSCSGVPLRVWDVSHNSQLTGIRNAWNNRYCGFTSADDAFLKRMLYIKYAQLDSDRVLHGCNNYNYTYQLALGESGVERVLLTPAQAANLLVGSCVCVGTATARSSSKATNTALLDRVLILSIETVEIGGVSYGAVYVDNGGQTFDTATSYYLYTYQWWAGATDAIPGNDGGENPANDRYPVKLQGIEYMNGCYEAAGDTIFTFGSIGGVQCQIANVCRDATKLATSVSANYKACVYGMPLPAASAWQWPKRLGHDPAMPEVMLGSVMGASSSSGTRDGCYNEKVGTTGLREWLRFGDLLFGLSSAGLSCCPGGIGLGSALWSLGGRLSVTGNRGEYQAAA